MDWKTTYETLKSFHDAAYKKIEEGIKHEQQNKAAEAADVYEQGLDFLGKALEMRVECPSNPDLSWEKACVMLQKMKKSKKEVEARLSSVKQAIAAVDLAPPPSYEEAIGLSSSFTSSTSSSTPSSSVPSTSTDGPSYPSGNMSGETSFPKSNSNIPSYSEKPSLNEKPLSEKSPLDEKPLSEKPLSEKPYLNEKPPSERTSLNEQPSNQNSPLSSLQNQTTSNNLDPVQISSDPAADPNPLTYSQLSDALRNIKLENEGQPTQVIYTVNNVEVYYINPEGNVSSTPGSDSLNVLRILNSNKKYPEKHRKHRHHHLGGRHRHRGSRRGSSTRSDSDQEDEESLTSHRGGSLRGHRHKGKLDLETKKQLEIQKIQRKYEKLVRKHERKYSKSEYDDDDEIENEGQFLLQIGNWTYPLIPNISPYMLTNYGAFIFPNTVSNIEGEAIGVIVPSEAKEQLVTLLEEILHPPESLQHDRRRRSVNSRGEMISSCIEKGASYVSTGLIKSAEKAGQYLNYKTPKLIERLTPAQDLNSQHVNPNVASGLKTARNVSETAANVSGFLLNSLGTATKELGTYLAPHIHKGGAKLLSRTTGLDDTTAANKMSSFMNVAASAVEGFSTVSLGLESAASILGNSLASNTVKIVEHKYGQPMGRATEDTLQTVGNTLTVSANVKSLMPKGLAKTGLKSAGRGALRGFSQQVAFDNHYYFQPTQSSSLEPAYSSSSVDKHTK